MTQSRTRLIRAQRKKRVRPFLHWLEPVFDKDSDETEMLDEVEDERRRELVSLRKQLLPQTVSLLHSLLHNTGELHCFPRLSHAPLLFLHNTCELLCCPRLSPFSTPSILHFKYLSIERNLMAVVLHCLSKWRKSVVYFRAAQGMPGPGGPGGQWQVSAVHCLRQAAAQGPAQETQVVEKNFRSVVVLVLGFRSMLDRIRLR